jgi:hypothetical protein
VQHGAVLHVGKENPAQVCHGNNWSLAIGPTMAYFVSHCDMMLHAAQASVAQLTPLSQQTSVALLLLGPTCM